MALTRRQTEDPRVLRDTLNDLISTVEAVDGVSDATVLANIKAVADNITDVTAVAAIAADIDAALVLPGAPAVDASVDALVATVTIQATDLAGDGIKKPRAIRVWLADADLGEVSNASIASVTATTGTILTVVTALSDYEVVTDSAGKAVLAIIGLASGDKYVMAADNGGVASIKVNFEAT